MIWTLIALLCAFPAGYIIAWTARDELVSGKKWFWVLIIASFICAIVFYIFRREYLVLTSAFIAIVSGISLWKSNDKRWTSVKR
ncbi:MAG: hypothetical protein AAB966_01230 [Patescibacteria group bacterium]